MKTNFICARLPKLPAEVLRAWRGPYRVAYFRASLGIIAKSAGGRASRRSAYTRCAKTEEFDYSHKIDELQDHDVILPGNANREFADPDFLWAEVENRENRINSVFARTLEIAIPDEVPEDKHREFAEHMIGWIVEQYRLPAEWAIHKDKGQFRTADNFHVHATIATRGLDANGWLKNKDREFKQLCTKNKKIHGDARIPLRFEIADRMNAWMKSHGIDATVSAAPKPDQELVIPNMPKNVVRAFQRHQAEVADAHLHGLKAPPMIAWLNRYIQKFHAEHAAKKELEAAQSALNNIGTGDLTNDQPERLRPDDETIRTNTGTDTSVSSTNELRTDQERPDTPDQAGHNADYRNDHAQGQRRGSDYSDPEITHRNSDQDRTENRQAEMMDALAEINFGDAAIHQLQRTGAPDDYAEYLAEIEGHNRKQNNLEQLRKQREQLADQLAQITKQMEQLDNQIRDIQELAQAPPAETEDPHLAHAKELHEMEEDQRQFELENLYDNAPDAEFDAVFSHLQRLQRSAAPKPYEGVAEVIKDHNQDKKKEAALHLASIQRAANPAAYRSLGDMIQDHRRQREERAAYQRDLLALQNNPNKQEQENDHTNRAAQSNDDIDDQKAARTDGPEPADERPDGHTDKTNRRPSNDSKRTSGISKNDQNANKTSVELPPLSREAKAEMKRLEETKEGSPVQRSTVKPQKPPDITSEEARRLVIERAVDAIKRLLAAVLGFGHDPMERAAPAAGPRR